MLTEVFGLFVSSFTQSEMSIFALRNARQCIFPLDHKQFKRHEMLFPESEKPNKVKSLNLESLIVENIYARVCKSISMTNSQICQSVRPRILDNV